MADIFYAKEIMKNINNSTYHDPNGKPLRKIRGLYVTGVWRPPHYIERHLFVTNIGLNNIPAKIESFTEKTEDVSSDDYLNGLSNFTTSDITITRFTQKTEDASGNDYLNGLSNFTTSNIVYTKFTTGSKDASGNDYLNGLSNFTISDITITHYHFPEKIDLPAGPPTLQIKSISGSTATIEDVT